MSKSSFKPLYYICHKDNLQSILENGLQSRNRIEQQNIRITSISDAELLARRDKILPNNTLLQDCVNLYFQPRNAMLYRLITNGCGRDNLVILQISPRIWKMDGIYFSDRNAATFSSQFYDTVEDLQHIGFDVFDNEYWTDSQDTKQRMMAEVLVPNEILVDDIMTIYLHKTDTTIKRLAESKKIPISVEPYTFFSPTFKRRIGENISLLRGDMFFSTMQTFTISVNLKGVMGKGLASRTKYQFPDAYVYYQDDCKSKKLQVGKPTIFKRGIRIEEELADDPSYLDRSKLNGVRWFLFLPTKRHWRDNSNLADIEVSMQWLVENYKKEGIESIALPALGCGLGQLSWKEVGPMMCKYLRKMDINSGVYLPMENTLQDEWLTEAFLLSK